MLPKKSSAAQRRTSHAVRTTDFLGNSPFVSLACIRFETVVVAGALVEVGEQADTFADNCVFCR